MAHSTNYKRIRRIVKEEVEKGIVKAVKTFVEGLIEMREKAKEDADKHGE